MAAAQAGEPDSYRRLLVEVNGWLARYCGKRLPPKLIQEATQEALLAVHLMRDSHAPGRLVKPWISGIARRKCVDQLRTLCRTTCEQLEEHHAQTPDHGRAVVSAIVVNKLLGRLKPAQADVIRLVRLQGYSIDDAAQATGQSPSLVKVNIHRGLRRLRTVVRSPDPAPPGSGGQETCQSRLG